MIHKIFLEDVFLKAPHQHIALAIDKNGKTTKGLQAQIEKLYPHFRHIGRQTLGRTVQFSIGSQTFHAMVCRIKNRPLRGEAIKKCMEKIQVKNGEKIAVILMSQQHIGTDTAALHASETLVDVYNLHLSPESIWSRLKHAS